MEVHLLESVQAMSRADFEEFLLRELATLPLQPRARHVLHAIARLAPLRDCWAGSRRQIADAVVLLFGGSCSVETVDRGVDELYLRGHISTAGKNGSRLTYSIHWSSILDTPRPPQLIEQQHETTSVRPTKPDHLQRPNPAPSADHRHLRPAPDHGQQHSAPPDHGQAPTNRGHDHGHQPSDHGHFTASADAELNTSNSATALLQRRPADHGQPLWGRKIHDSEWRQPDELLPELFERCVEAGLANDTEADLLAFVAMVISVREQKTLRNPLGLITQIMRGRDGDKFGRSWRERPVNRHEDAALTIVRRIKGVPSAQDKPPATVAQAAEAREEARQINERQRTGSAALRAMMATSLSR